MKKVLLLNMPFCTLTTPAVGIGILKSYLTQRGISCDIAYPNILFAQSEGIDFYNFIDDTIGMKMFPGDWLFARYLFGDSPDDEVYLNTLRSITDESHSAFLQRVSDPKSLVQRFFSRLLSVLDISQYSIVGFTTTFQQNMASIAFAHLIKSMYPHIAIVFGGGNCEDIMGLELHRSFSWIDYVCGGEADTSFPPLVEAIFEEKPVDSIKGIVYRKDGNSIFTGPPSLVENLDEVPVPDYDDYFLSLEQSSLSSFFSPLIPIQSARGCWWGQKSTCRFCGLNGDSLKFRSKSALHLLEELRYLNRRHHVNSFEAVDNIMDMNYFRTLLPLLKEENPRISIFYEVKSNLNKDQVKLLKEAGVNAIQPGVESLNTHVLDLMKKGVTSLQNIQMLKWCQQFGVDPKWNLLYGFPGETPEDYEKLHETIDSINHLPPPVKCGSFRLDRFSPFFRDSSDYGLVDVRPFEIFRFIYPLPPERISNLVYFFQFEYENPAISPDMTGKLEEKVEMWRKNRGGKLEKTYKNHDEMILDDTRVNRVQAQMLLKGIQQDVYDYCDSRRRFSDILDHVHRGYSGGDVVSSWLPKFLDQMVDWRCMMKEGDEYLSLAI